MFKQIRDFLSPENRRVIGEEARQLLANPHLKDAFAAVESYLIEKARACDTNKPGHADNIVTAMQLLEAIKREITRKVEDGEVAQIEIAELERRKPLLRRIER